MFLDFILLDKETRDLRMMNRIMKPIQEIDLKDTAIVLVACKILRSKLLFLKVRKAKRYLDVYLSILEIHENLHTNIVRKYPRRNHT